MPVMPEARLRDRRRRKAGSYHAVMKHLRVVVTDRESAGGLNSTAAVSDSLAVKSIRLADYAALTLAGRTIGPSSTSWLTRSTIRLAVNPSCRRWRRQRDCHTARSFHPRLRHVLADGGRTSDRLTGRMAEIGREGRGFWAGAESWLTEATPPIWPPSCCLSGSAPMRFVTAASFERRLTTSMWRLASL